MRYSYSKKLLREEYRQRGDRYGRQARTRQLTALTLLSLSLYTICTVNIWRHPRPVHHVWIDGVLVEVMEENWVDHARGTLLYLGLAGAALLGLLRLLGGVVPTNAAAAGENELSLSSARPHEQCKRRHAAADSRGGAANISTIAVPSWARQRTAKYATPPPLPQLFVTKEGGAQLASGVDRVSTFDVRRPMRSDADLNRFLTYEAAQSQQQLQQQCRSSSESVGLRYRGGLEDVAAAYPTEVDAAARDALSVSYETRGASREHQRGVTATSAAGVAGAPSLPSSSSTLPWGEFGIDHLEEGLQRTREWMSDVCRKLVADVDQCDRWFSEHQCEAYDCHHSLQEQLPAPVAPAMASAARPGGMWGQPSAPVAAPAAPKTETKQTALLREKARCRQVQQGMLELDTALRYDQRLALESRLDVSGTFPPSSGAPQSNAELTAMREYVVERLRTFAKQHLLVSYNATGGDAETWRSGYPCDAHLLLHVLRFSVKGLKEYVRFGYQTSSQTQDLALYVGDTGEPYFYVRFRQGSSETLLSTRQGPTSLMEAVLAFAAVIHTYYRDVFGSVRGTVDLSEVGLLRVVTESRRRPRNGGFGGEW